MAIEVAIDVLGPIGFCKASKRHPDVAQPQLTTATFLGLACLLSTLVYGIIQLY